MREIALSWKSTADFRRRLDRAWRGRALGVLRRGALLLVASALCGLATRGERLDAPLVVTQVPLRAGVARAERRTPEGWARLESFDGSRLVVVSPDGVARPLSEGFASACDPDVSFDARRILFAGRKQGETHWRIWEMNLDGTGPRPISPEGQHARSPIYVSSLFTLNSPEPWLTVVYVDVQDRQGEKGGSPFSALYSVRLDGSDFRRLTYTPSSSFDPFQAWDGRVLYAGERHSLEPSPPRKRVGLFGIHIDGADMELFGGQQGRPFQWMPCVTEKGLVVFVESEGDSLGGAGLLACVHESRPSMTYRRLTTDAGWSHLYPSPITGNCLLVARAPTDGGGTWGIHAFDADQGTFRPVFDSPEFDEVQAKILRPKDQPDGHSTVVDDTAATGVFYGMNCYDAEERIRKNVMPGTFKRVRLIEGVIEKTEFPDEASASVSSGLRKRLLGEAPIETDGSFNVEVPAKTLILLQALDERGLALATCGWIWVQPKETRGCIGCHEDPERVPENEYVLALRRPSNRLVLPPAQRRALSFREEIAPLLQRHCAAAECHGAKDAMPHLPLTSHPPILAELEASFAALMAAEDGTNNQGPAPSVGRYVDAGRARTSWLIWQLAGQDTSRPWDWNGSETRFAAREVRKMPPPGKGTPLRSEQVRTLIQWIDLGAQFDTVEFPLSSAAPRAQVPSAASAEPPGLR